MEIHQIVNAKGIVHKVPIHTQIHQQIYVQRAILNANYAQLQGLIIVLVVKQVIF